MSDLGAVVLCGGQSRRMGRDKAWLPFGPDEVLLQRVVRRLGEAVDAIVVVAAPDQALPPLPPSVRIARDRISNRGPLQGLASGLDALPDSISFAYATATDTPFLEPSWIAFLRRQIGKNDVAIPRIGGRHHPLAALYRRKTIIPVTNELLGQGCSRMMDLVNAVDSIEFDEGEFRAIDPELRTIENLNTCEDYEKAPRAVAQMIP